MLHRITNFFRQLYNSKGFRRGLRIFIGVFTVYYIYNVIIYLKALMSVGVSLGEAIRCYFELPFVCAGCLPPSAGVALGIVIGLVWYFNMKKSKQENAEPDQTAEEFPDAEQEKEIIETTHRRYQ